MVCELGDMPYTEFLHWVAIFKYRQAQQELANEVAQQKAKRK